MIKEWFTPNELEDLKLSDLPSSRMAIANKAKKEKWKSRPRQGRGGGKEYHISALPETARVELARRNMKEQIVALKNSELKIIASMNGLNQKQKTKAEARLVLVRQLEQFATSADLAMSNAAEKFAFDYENGDIPVESWVKALIPSFSGRSIIRWKQNSKELNLLGDKRGLHRKGQSKIDQNTEIRDLIVGMLATHYNPSARNIMRALRARFSPSSLPSYRRLQAWIAEYKKDNDPLLKAIQAPDEFKNKYQSAAGSRSEDVVALNQLWEFDSTPTDVMLADGKRHNIIGVIDVYSRRLKLHVSKTSRSSAITALLRKALLDWGVPEFVKMDNGADYKARNTQKALEALKIWVDWCTPFTPEEKPHVERAFKSFSHGILELLPGYIGHNVADRKNIEAQKSFAERLTKRIKNQAEYEAREPEKINMTAEEFQQFCDDWCENMYHHDKHRSLGCTPFEKAQDWGQATEVPEALRLEIALAEVAGERVITKKGIRFNGDYYSKDALGGLEGQKVLLRYDESDWGVLYVYTLNNEFICKALSPERMGISRADEANARRKIQKRIMGKKIKEVKGIARQVGAKDIAKEIMEDAKRRNGHKKVTHERIEYSTPALEQAKIASGAAVEPAPLTPEQKAEMRRLEAEEREKQKVISIDDPEAKYRKAKRILLSMNNVTNEEFTDAEILWAARYRKGSEFRGREMLDENPIDWASFG